MNNPASSLRQLHILIVEDDDSFRAALAGVLTHLGHTVCSVADGESINRILADQPIDCILLDRSLAGENGIALARRLRVTFSGIIVMLSGHQQPDGLEGLVDLYLLKPVNPVALHTTLLNLASAQPHKGVD